MNTDSHTQPTTTSAGDTSNTRTLTNPPATGSGSKIRGVINTVEGYVEAFRNNLLDAADAATGTGRYTKPTAPRWNDTVAGRSTPPLHPRHQTQSAQQTSEHVGATSINTTSGPTAGYGAGLNPMRASNDRDEADEARIAAAQRVHTEERGTMPGDMPYDSTVPAPGNVGATVAGGGPAHPI